MSQQRSSTRRNLSITLGIASLLITLSGLLVGAAVFASLPNQLVSIIVNGSEEIQGTPLPDVPPVVIVEDEPTPNNFSAMIPLLLTSLGAFTSFGALVLEWRRDKREAQEDDLALRIQKIDLELKKLQLQKMRQELEQAAEQSGT